MKDSQENKLTMYEAVLSLLRLKLAIITSIPALLNSRDEFALKITEIKEMARQKREVTAGKRAAKADAENILISVLMSVGSALFSFGRKIKDSELQALSNIRVSRLEDMRDTELVSKAETVYGKLQENIDKLSDYNITPEIVTDLRIKIDNFANALGERESAAAKGAGATANLKALFNQADEMLYDDMDRLIELLRESNGEFYNEYFAARVIKDLGIRHRTDEPVTPPPPTP